MTCGFKHPSAYNNGKPQAVLQKRNQMLLHKFNWNQEVLDSHEPVLVDFWAPWCPPCRAINPTIESLAADFKVCKVNIDTNQELATRYGVSSIPTLLIFKDGQIAAQHVGVTPEATLRAELQRLSAATVAAKGN
jgi:thioredoxin 1